VDHRADRIFIQSQDFISVKYYITTPIYYVNDRPHIGHAYTTIIADTLARYWRLRGADVYFLTGTDENSQKNVEAAEKNNEDTKTYIDRMSTLWEKTWRDLHISHDDFIRTTEDRHHRGVEEFWKRVESQGDIYLGTYIGWYCVGCEAFITETEASSGACPIHKKPLKKIEEQNYFFKLSKYRDALLAHIEKNPDFIQPESRRNEIVSYIKDFMTDMSISRQSVKWGIPVPAMSGVSGQVSDVPHVIYVWFDALINYLTGIGFGTDEKKFNRFWPADLHLVGKDIIKFHVALWPAMLIAAGLPLPKRVFAHGFFTVNGDKMSKSLNNFVDPFEIVKAYNLDTLRYYLLRDIMFGEDGDFSMERLRVRYESELANDLGNLAHRVMAMAEKYMTGLVPEPSAERPIPWRAYDDAFESLHIHDAVGVVWSVIRDANRYVDETQPWVLAKTDPQKLRDVLYALLETLRHIALMLHPILPETSVKIFGNLGMEENDILGSTYTEAQKWGGLQEGAVIKKGAPLFPRIEPLAS